jgi:hypothetical protein
MVRRVQVKTGQSYRDQLDRVRRFLERVEIQNRSDVEYQDLMWAFFQNCWHLKDWVSNDTTIPKQMSEGAVTAAHRSPVLMVCRDLACAMKHLSLDDPKTGAAHSHTNTTIQPGSPTVVDTIVDMGDGTTRSGLALAQECVAEWERILKQAGLGTARRS